MIRKDYIGATAFGMKFNYIHFAPKEPCDFGVVFLHGIGERGPIDGSKLELVLKNGYPRHAAAGFEFPFHLLVPQCASSYNQIKYFMPAYAKLWHKLRVVYVMGLSMGGFGAFDTVYYDKFRLVDGVVPICGGMDSKLAASFPEMPGWAFHGDADKTVPYSKSKSFVDAYNSTHDTEWGYTLYPGVGHNSWEKACSVTPGQDQLLEWLKQQFKEAPKPVVDLETFKAKIIEAVKAVQ